MTVSNYGKYGIFEETHYDLFWGQRGLTGSRVVALPVSPHELDETSGLHLGGGSDGSVVVAILGDVAGDGLGLNFLRKQANHQHDGGHGLTSKSPSVTGPLSLNLRVILLTGGFLEGSL